MRGLVQAWAKNSVVTGAVRYPLSPVVSSPEPSLHRVCRRSFPPSDRAIAGHCCPANLSSAVQVPRVFPLCLVRSPF